MLLRDERPGVYQENGYTIYRASSFGLPPRSLVSARLGAEPMGAPGPVRDAAREGTRLEDHVLALVMLHGYALSDQQREVELVFERLKVKLRGHIDALAEDGFVLAVLCCDSKTVTDEGMIEFRRKGLATKSQWAWQFSVYAAALGLEYVLVAVFNRDAHYRQEAGDHVPPEQLFQLKQFPVPYTRADIEGRIEELEGYVIRKELPPPERCSGFDPWAYCNRHAAEEAPELAELLAEYEALHVTDKRSKARKNELKETIAFWLDGRPKVTAGGLEATFSETVTERLDTARFKRDHPELYQKYTVKSSSTRLLVRRAS